MTTVREQVEDIWRRASAAPSSGGDAVSRFSEMLNRQLRALWDAISAVADAIDGLEQP